MSLRSGNRTLQQPSCEIGFVSVEFFAPRGKRRPHNRMAGLRPVSSLSNLTVVHYLLLLDYLLSVGLWQ